MPCRRIRNPQGEAIGDNWWWILLEGGVAAGGIQESYRDRTVVWESSHCSPSGATLIGCFFCSKARSCILMYHQEPMHCIFPSGRAAVSILCCCMGDGSPSSVKGAGVSDGDTSLADSSHHWCAHFQYSPSLLPRCLRRQWTTEVKKKTSFRKSKSSFESWFWHIPTVQPWTSI